MKTIRLSVALAVCGFVSVAVARPADTDPREKVTTAVPEAVRLLEKKEYETFLKEFMTPEDLKKVTQRIPLADFAKRFGEDKAPRLLMVLKMVKDNKPVLDADGKKAGYEFEKPGLGKGTISFIKIGKYWYLKN